MRMKHSRSRRCATAAILHPRRREPSTHTRGGRGWMRRGKRKSRRGGRLCRNGAPGEIRTPDPQVRSLVLYPTELRARMKRLNRGGAEGDRTPDLVIANDALSQLSYGPVQVWRGSEPREGGRLSEKAAWLEGLMWVWSRAISTPRIGRLVFTTVHRDIAGLT